MIELVKDLVLIESPSTEPDSQAAILARLQSEFEQLDYRVTRLPGKTCGGPADCSSSLRGRGIGASSTSQPSSLSKPSTSISEAGL